MKKKYVKVFAGVFILWWSISVKLVWAQVPEWSVNPAQYSNSMAMVGIIKIDRVESADENDLVAAFINGECRGVAPLLFEEDVNRYMAYLLVYANETSAQVNFKVYDASEEKVYEVPRSHAFIVNGLVGEIELPYLWSDVMLNQEAVFTSFSINGQLGETQMRDQEISVNMPTGADLKTLTANYTVSNGASVWVNGNRQRSGNMNNDFTEPVIYVVQSEDQNTQNSYTVIVNMVDPQPHRNDGIPLSAVNAITPNGDGVNDNWIVRNLQLFEGYQLSIYDSSGRLLYQTNNYQNEWEGTYQGKPLEEGIYYYLFTKGADAHKGIISIIK